MIEGLNSEIVKTRSNAGSLEESFVFTKHVMMEHYGKKISLAGLTRLYSPEGEEPEVKAAGPSILLIFSELSCNVCQDEESQFARELAEELGPNHVSAVIHSDNQRYARNYVRLNQANFPIYHIKNHNFLQENGLDPTPLVLFLDESDRVIFAHHPLPGKPELSKPFHDFCRNYFGLTNAKDHNHGN